jgi:miniconductance mechanosensitive channel
MAMFTSIETLRASIEAEPIAHFGVAAIILLLGAMVGYFFVKLVLHRIAHVFAPSLGSVAAEFISDDVLFKRLALFVPALIVYQCVALLPGISEVAGQIVQKGAVVIAVIIGLGVLTRFMFKGNEIYCRYPISQSRPIKGYLQILSIFLYAVGIIIIIATILDKSPLVFVSGLGAMTAVILLVFRDTLLSLVAGVQLTTNDLIRVGDWIEMPQFAADGDVIDIALHTVKVQNWDKTITTIPTHKFLEHSFKNWRGMSESGGRRIKRSIHIDMNTVRFLSDQEVERFSHFALLKEYIQTKREELSAYNRERISEPDGVLVANARRLTNIGTFRAYLINYLRQHPQIHQQMTFLVRQLQPTPEGLPLEVYVFSRDIRWGPYEGTQADIFDHILAVISEFDLRVYQRPSGNDLKFLQPVRQS